MAQPIIFNTKLDLGGLNVWREGVSVAIRKSATMAGSSALRAMRAEGSREIRAQKAVKVAAVNKAISLIFPTRKEQLIWALRAKGEALPVIAYQTTQTKKGVSVLINRGARSLILHAFKARMGNAHLGVFQRLGPYRPGLKGKYQGKMRQRIREAFTTTVSNAFEDAVPAMSARGASVFRTTFVRVLPLEEAKRRAKGRS